MLKQLFLFLCTGFLWPVHACSIVGYIGKKPAKYRVLQALQRLEYRGYDSAGFACLNQKTGKLVRIRATGKLQNLINKLDRDPLDGCIAIGHTRWATHGAATEENAHPHNDCLNTLSVVHNGIIENYYVLKEKLCTQGHVFKSTTDTEVIAHLFEDVFKEDVFKKESRILGIAEVIKQLNGAYGLAVLSQQLPDTLIAVRKGSPICLGRANDGLYIASDSLAFDASIKEVCYIPDASFALITCDHVTLYDFTGKELSIIWQPFAVPFEVNNKGGYAHFMLKEICEQAEAIKATVGFYRSIKDRLLAQLNFDTELFKNIKELVIVACGTSWHAGRIGQFFFESIAHVPTSVHLASEFRYAPFIARDDTLYIAISQSGETADTLEALRLISARHLSTLTITNVACSTMARETKGCLLTLAGPEVAVASTKAFTTQLTALYWLAHIIAWQKGLIDAASVVQAEDDLVHAGNLLRESIDKNSEHIAHLVDTVYAHYTKFFFLGRHVGYPFAIEAALKLKEIAYVFAMGYPAGELKHGSIALVDDQMPVIMFSSTHPVIYSKIVSNAQEVKARGGRLFVVAFEGQRELMQLADDIVFVPAVVQLLEPLVMSGVMQLFAYHMAKYLCRDIDKPRNLAKSVTVE